MRVRTILPSQAWMVTKWVGGLPSNGYQTKSCNVLVHRGGMDPEVVTMFLLYNKKHAYFLAESHDHSITPYECPGHDTLTEAKRAAEEWVEAYAKGK